MEKTRPSGLKKFCCYFGCSNNSIKNSNYTFFAFPKSEERRELWCKLAGITPTVGENRAARFLCELHFADIYMCRSPRRILLLHTAVPYPCEKVSECMDETSDSIEPIVPGDTNDEGTDSQEHIETVAQIEQLEEEDMKVVIALEEEFKIESQPVKEVPVLMARKRKDPITKIVEMKAKLIKTGPPVSSQNQPSYPTTTVTEYQPLDTLNQGFKPAQKSPATSSTKTDQRANEPQTSKQGAEVSKRNQMSEFIFKGEEYVQMPKAVYERQIEELKRKVARYENILLTMRDLINEVNVDDSLDS